MEIAQATNPTAIMGFAIQVTMNTENILKERSELNYYLTHRRKLITQNDIPF